MPEIKASNADLDGLSTGEVTDGLKLVNFEVSPIMSTYLVAVVVGEYEFVEGKTKDNILVRSYTPVMETLTPQDFLAFRDSLVPASGSIHTSSSSSGTIAEPSSTLTRTPTCARWGGASWFSVFDSSSSATTPGR